jgi:plasmid stabilization system protein ParE
MTPRRAVIRTEFWHDLIEQADYYDNQHFGLGREFENEVRHKVREIAEQASAYRPYKGTLRRVLAGRFKHYLVFDVSESEVFFIGVVHASRHFDGWLKHRTRG